MTIRHTKTSSCLGCALLAVVAISLGTCTAYICLTICRP